MKKYTLITGAAGGLGRGFTLECAKRKHNLLLTDVSEDRLNNLKDYLNLSADIDILIYPCDLTDLNKRKGLFEFVKSNNIHIDIAINVAGLDFEGLVESLSSEKVSTMCRLNLEATYDINRFIMTNSKSEKYYIINTASLAGFYPMPYKALYAASKSAVAQFSLALREEAMGKGNITALCPAGLRTTPELCKKIDSQGFMGKITTIDINKVAKKTVDKVYKNQPIYIPGFVNRVMLFISSLMPKTITAKIVNKRWSTREVED